MVQSGVLNHTMSYTYNNNFLVSSMTYANQTENYTYNDDSEVFTCSHVARGSPYSNQNNHGTNTSSIDEKPIITEVRRSHRGLYL